MKSHFYTTIILLLLATSATQAQQKTNTLTAPRFVAGIEAGISKECMNHDSTGRHYLIGGYRKDKITYPSVGLFARYSISEHFAIQAGISYNFIKKTSYEVYNNRLAGTAIYADYNATATRSFDVPLSIQYFMQPSGTRVRSYFGAGVLTRLNFYTSDGVYTSGSTTIPVSANTSNIKLFPMVSQGITWQINKKWQFNESVNFMMTYGSTALSFKLGLAYTIK